MESTSDPYVASLRETPQCVLGQRVFELVGYNSPGHCVLSSKPGCVHVSRSQKPAACEQTRGSQASPQRLSLQHPPGQRDPRCAGFRSSARRPPAPRLRSRWGCSRRLVGDAVPQLSLLRLLLWPSRPGKTVQIRFAVGA